MFIVILGWVLFRANGLMDAINYLSIMFGINKATTVTYQFSYFVNKKIGILDDHIDYREYSYKW